MHTLVCWQISTRLFIASLFINAPNWKQPTYPSAVKWMNKLSYVCCIAVGYCATKKISSVCNNMDRSTKYKEARHKRIYTL